MFRQQTLKEMSSYYVLLTIGTTSYIVLRNKYINKQQLLYKNNNYNNTNNNNDNSIKYHQNQYLQDEQTIRQLMKQLSPEEIQLPRNNQHYRN